MSAAASALDVSAARDQIAKAWDADVLQTLKDYISIPNQVSETREKKGGEDADRRSETSATRRSLSARCRLSVCLSGLSPSPP